MPDPLKALSRETLIYGASTVLGRFLNFLLVPFYVNVLRSTAEYGIATSLYTYLGFFNVLYTLGLEAAYFRYGARGEGEAVDPDREKKSFSTPFWFIAAVSALLSAAIALAAPALVGPVFRDPRVDIAPLTPALVDILRLGAAILFFDNVATLPFAALRLEHQAARFSALRLTGILITLVLNYLFIVTLDGGVRGIFWANLIGSATVFLLLIPTVRPRLAFSLDGAVLKKYLPFGLTNVPAYLSSMMVQVIDRPLIQAFLGLGVLGVYQANYRMGFIMMVLVGLFEYAWRPFFMRQALKDDAAARLLFARVFTHFTVVVSVAFLGLSWGLPFLVTTPVHGRSLLKPAYWEGLPLIPVVLLAYVFQGLYTNFIAGIYIKEKNKVLPWITGLGALVNVLVNLWLIPRHGMMGAALATLFAYMTMAGALYAVARRVYPIPYDWPKVGRLALLVAVAEALERGLTFAHAPGLPYLRGLLFLAVLGTLWAGGYFPRRFRRSAP